MSAVQGWDSSPASSASTSSSEALRERYVERTLEKILRYQKQPKTRPMDLVLLGALVLTLGVVFVRTGHSAPVTASSLSQVDSRLDKLSAQEELIHQQLTELKGLRHDIATLKGAAPIAPLELGMARTPVHLAPPPPVVAATAPTLPHAAPALHPAPNATPATALKPPTKPVAIVTPAAMTGEQVHVLQTGESLWSISEKYYHDSRMLDALAHYNGISDPGRMHVGMTIKIPPAATLQGQPVAPAAAPSPAKKN